jgi:hypothetical protein
MNPSREILDFLTKPENIHVALEVSEYVETLKRQTHHDFWVSMNQMLAVKVESEFRGQWAFQKFPINNLRSDWKIASIRMHVHQESAPPLLSFGVGQDSQEKKYQLFCGVLHHNVEGVSLIGLRGLLVSLELGNTSDYWAGWGNLPVTPFTPEFVSSVHGRRDAFVAEVADMVWERFTRLRSEMEAINQEILRASA